MKRFLDVILSAAALLVLAPLLIVIWMLIRVTMGSPAIFAQRRPGRGGRPFMLFKFRTMQAADSDDVDTDTDQHRLTRLGRILRSTSLDELPELWNILRGDMSLVGPRPLLEEYLPLYTAQQARRHEVRPGLTGWAQVNGRNTVDWDKRFELDVWYVDHATIMLDFRILLKTVLQVLRPGETSSSG
ncbi:MAG: sugar transferase, partial [Phycisphaerales bacterium]|nr:sugar transferase [Phycisphaerales bacterium]